MLLCASRTAHATDQQAVPTFATERAATTFAAKDCYSRFRTATYLPGTERDRLPWPASPGKVRLSTLDKDRYRSSSQGPVTVEETLRTNRPLNVDDLHEVDQCVSLSCNANQAWLPQCPLTSTAWLLLLLSWQSHRSCDKNLRLGARHSSIQRQAHVGLAAVEWDHRRAALAHCSLEHGRADPLEHQRQLL